MLAKTVGFFFPSAQSNNQQNQDSTVSKLDINLAALYQEAGLRYIDDAFRILGSLQDKKCLEIKRDIKFKRGRYVDVCETMLNWLNTLINEFLISTKGGQKEITEEMFSSVLVFENNNDLTWAKKSDQYKRVGQRRCIRTLLRLLAASQIKVRKQLNIENQPVYVLSISDSQY